MSIHKQIEELKSLAVHPEWKIIVDASNLEIEAYEKSLDEELKVTEKMTSHTLARRVLKKMHEMLINVQTRLAGIPGSDLICDRIIEAMTAWKNGLYYNEGQDFELKFSEHDFERKYRHILWCLTVMPDTLISNLEKEIPAEQLEAEENEVLGE